MVAGHLIPSHGIRVLLLVLVMVVQQHLAARLLLLLQRHGLPPAFPQPPRLPPLLVLDTALVHCSEPGHLHQLAACEDGGPHQETEGASDVAEEVNGAVTKLLLDELILEVLEIINEIYFDFLGSGF